MFIRIKKIKGQNYGYLVENSWTGQGARQKVGKYLGKVIAPTKHSQLSAIEHFKHSSIQEFLTDKDFKTLIFHLVELELVNHGLPKDSFNLQTLTFHSQGRKVLFQTNQGYLCQHTLQKLLDYKSEGDDGFALANLLVSAGLNVEKSLFVEIFARYASPSPSVLGPSDEFYY